jgi:hypothetical protein
MQFLVIPSWNVLKKRFSINSSTELLKKMLGGPFLGEQLERRRFCNPRFARSLALQIVDADRLGFAGLKLRATPHKNNFINDVMGELQKNLSERFKMASECFKKIRGTFSKTALFNRIMQVRPSHNFPQNVGFWRSGNKFGALSEQSLYPHARLFIQVWP